VGSERQRAFNDKMARLAAARTSMRELNLTPNAAQKRGISVRLDGTRRTALDLLSLPGVDIAALVRIWPEIQEFAPDVVEQLEIDAQYAGYLDRQEADILAFRRDEALNLPADLDYQTIAGLSTEVVQKLGRIRPTTLGQAARIDGITPAALTIVLAHVRASSPARRAG
jgi:tRNA uridine 5-carboxymethylaminomethyl modification enzyme